MTLADILALRQADPRAFDALVAGHLFGWRWWKFQPYRCRAVDRETLEVSDNGKPHRFYGPPETFKDPLDRDHTTPWDGVEELQVARGTYDPTPPGFATDPAADLEAHRVTCGWDTQRKRWYFAWLGLMLSNRLFNRQDLSPRCDYPLEWLESYRCGDYSSAALAVTMEGKDR